MASMCPKTLAPKCCWVSLILYFLYSLAIMKGYLWIFFGYYVVLFDLNVVHYFFAIIFIDQWINYKLRLKILMENGYV